MYFPLNQLKFHWQRRVSGSVSVALGDSFPTHTIWLESPVDLRSPLYHRGAEMLLGQPCAAHFRVAITVYSFRPRLGPKFSLGLLRPNQGFWMLVPSCSLVQSCQKFSPAPARELQRPCAWYRCRHRVLMDTELPEGKGNLSLILSS